MKEKLHIYRDESFVDVHYHGRHYRLSDSDLGIKKRSGQAGAVAGSNTAPLPGKIISVAKQLGDSCMVGDVIVVMEAMKMEYKIKANKAGTVAKLLVAPGDVVALGAQLFVIE